MAQTSMIHIRVDHDVKSQASEALAAMGLSVSDAVRIFLKRVVNDQAFPLELKVPNAETRAAIEESRALMKARERDQQPVDPYTLGRPLFGRHASGEPDRSQRRKPIIRERLHAQHRGG